MYFTVCAAGDRLYPDRNCCQDRVMSLPPLSYCVPPVEKHHCCLFDRIRKARDLLDQLDLMFG